MSDDPHNITTAGTIIQLSTGELNLVRDDRHIFSSAQKVSNHEALSWLKIKVGRELTNFEALMLLAELPGGGSKRFTVIYAVFHDRASPEQNAFPRFKSVPIGYVIRLRFGPGTVNYGDVIQTEGFYDKDGKIYGEVRKFRKQEPSLQAPLLDPIDLIAGPLANIARSAAKKLINTAAAGIEARLLAQEVAVFAGPKVPSATSSAMGVARITVEHSGRRTIIAGADMAKMRANLTLAAPQAGLYDVAIHGDDFGFKIIENVGGKAVARRVTVAEVAEIIRPHLAAGDAIRLLSCKVGATGGPAQQLANLLNRRVWGATTKVPQQISVVSKGGKTSFVPRADGKFHEFIPERGAAWSGGAKVTGNELKGEIRNAH